VRTLPAIGLLVAVALIVVAGKYVAGHWELGLIASPLVAVAWLAWGRWATLRREVLGGVAVASALFCGLMFGWGTVVVDSTRSMEPLFSRIRATAPQTRIASYKCLESSWVFYGGRPFLELQSEPTGVESFSKPKGWMAPPRLAPSEYLLCFGGGLVLTTREHLSELQAQLPAEYQVLAECDYFLRDERLVLLGPKIDSLADEAGTELPLLRK
jgi:hypothetical protein